MKNSAQLSFFWFTLYFSHKSGSIKRRKICYFNEFIFRQQYYNDEEVWWENSADHKQKQKQGTKGMKEVLKRIKLGLIIDR